MFAGGLAAPTNDSVAASATMDKVETTTNQEEYYGDDDEGEEDDDGGEDYDSEVDGPIDEPGDGDKKEADLMNLPTNGSYVVYANYRVKKSHGNDGSSSEEDSSMSRADGPKEKMTKAPKRKPSMDTTTSSSEEDEEYYEDDDSEHDSSEDENTASEVTDDPMSVATERTIDGSGDTEVLAKVTKKQLDLMPEVCRPYLTLMSKASQTKS